MLRQVPKSPCTRNLKGRYYKSPAQMSPVMVMSTCLWITPPRHHMSHDYNNSMHVQSGLRQAYEPPRVESYSEYFRTGTMTDRQQVLGTF